jgi:hypothetical protein
VYIETQFFDSKAPYKEGAMYAIVEIAGKQYKVNTEETITVPTLEKQPGDKVTFDKVLLVGDPSSKEPLSITPQPTKSLSSRKRSVKDTV